MISTFHSGLARRASTQTLTGVRPGVTQLSQALFMPTKSAMSATQTEADNR